MRARMVVNLIVLVALVSFGTSCTTDTGITTKVKSKMMADETVRAYEIEVATHAGVVTLTGNIDSRAAKDRALALANDTKGVTKVVDMIAVRTAEGTGDAPSPGRMVGEHVDDAGITLRVKAKLLEDPVVKGLDIDVDTRDGVVYLTGVVRSEREQDTAIRLARETRGVRDVQPNFSIG